MTNSVQKTLLHFTDVAENHRSILYGQNVCSYIRYDMVWPFEATVHFPVSACTFIEYCGFLQSLGLITPIPPVFSTQQVVCTSPGGSDVGDALVHARMHRGGHAIFRAPRTQARAAILKVTPHSGSDRAAVRNHDWRWRILSSWRDMPDSEMGKRSIVWLNSRAELLLTARLNFVCLHSGKLDGWFCADLRL